MIIEDSTGTGYGAKIDAENRLHVKSIGVNFEHVVNHNHGDSYTAGFSVTPTAAGDCFGYITNNGSKDLVLTTLMLSAASDEVIQMKIGDTGTAVGGAEITLVNRNAGSGNEADVTSEQGVDITGLAGGSVVAGLFIQGGESSLQVNIPSSIIIPKNKTVSFYVVTGGIAVMVGCSIYFHDEQ